MSTDPVCWQCAQYPVPVPGMLLRPTRGTRYLVPSMYAVWSGITLIVDCLLTRSVDIEPAASGSTQPSRADLLL